MVATERIAGLILAGGQSRRMGGGEKFLLPFAGGTLLDRVVARLSPQVGAIAVSANCDPALLGHLPFPILPDGDFAGRGPLAGLHAGLSWAREQGATHLVSTAADTPFFPMDMVSRLSAGDAREIAVAATHARAHPVFALWPVAFQPVLAVHLAGAARFSIMGFIEDHPHRLVAFGDEGGNDPFFNVNTPEDFILAEAIATGEK